MANPVQKTTVYLDTDVYRRLKALAQARRQKTAHLLREAVAQYAARESPRRAPHSLGAGSSGRGDLSERAEELLSGMGLGRRGAPREGVRRHGRGR